ncbi:MAG: hypothetical protein IJ796_10975 [Lachnospiraceae bacterium]|nr:hypothetical protein [Lachnospiraceae bacterium]
MSRKTLFFKLKLIFLVLYFIILFVERLLAVILSVKSGGEYALVSGNIFNYFAYGVTAVSLLAGTALMIRVIPGMLISILSSREYAFSENYRRIVIAAMAILFGGMMHTGFTFAPMQFVAYGFLIASMVVRTIECCRNRRSSALRFASIVSIIYLTLLAMAVPVSYISHQSMPIMAVFYVVEFCAVIVLVPVFGKLLLVFYDKGVTSFSFIYPVILILLSGFTVALKWTEEINWFVLIFLVLTEVFYLSFGLVARRKSR